MELIGCQEFIYRHRHLGQVRHVTLDPAGPGVVRLHMVPPRFTIDKSIPYVVIVNGQDVVPVNLSWAILLAEFMDAMLLYEYREISESDWKNIVEKTIRGVQKVYRGVDARTIHDDLWRIIDALTDIAQGKKPAEEIGLIPIGEYARNMRAPHRMDLMISSMSKDGVWNCNQCCLHCYAATQEKAEGKELSTRAWKAIIQRCRKAGIPQITFTGGEPTLRDDLVELVDYSKWFITRLNTNGVCLSGELCRRLCEASLDSVQVTLYSADPQIHNVLVGAKNWEKTIEGIKNALDANLSVSVNTPLCSINKEYTETLRLIHTLGVRYVSCSGLIIAGKALAQRSASTQLSEQELCLILSSARQYCRENYLEINFTSPGWVHEENLREIGFTSIPTCGACLSNMAVAPDGNVVPCQSWLSGDSLGNMLTDSWQHIWNGRLCRTIRGMAGQMEQRCLLRQPGKESAP
jgi:MoaA/NifB/PqqE/SkfB family radical SAM enzyme